MDNNQTKKEGANLVPFENFEAVLGDPVSFFIPPSGGASYLRVFVDAVGAGFYPPRETINWLFVAFQKYLDGGGEMDLEDVLDLNSGPGKISFFSEENQIKKEAEIVKDVDAIQGLGLSTSKACKAVEEKMAAGFYSGFEKSRVVGVRMIRNYHNNGFGDKDIITKDKPYVFNILITTNTCETVLVAASSDVTGTDIREKASNLAKEHSINVRVENLMERGLKALKAFPIDTQMWVKNEIK